jgi:hypothetical protein
MRSCTILRVGAFSVLTGVRTYRGSLSRGTAVFIGLCLVLACGARAAAVGPHKSLDNTAGKCSILGGDTAFYVCPPFAGVLPVGDGSVSAHVHWALLGHASSSNGRRSFDDVHGVVQVVLVNGWPLGPGSGVLVTGRVAPQSLVVASFWPQPALVGGHAVWRLPNGASKLRVETSRSGRTVSLVADGRFIPPTLLIPPARVLRSVSVIRLFRSDMNHLATVADGNVSGACSFFAPRLNENDDRRCAQTIGLYGEAAAVRASISSARFWSYNGWTLASSTIDREPLSWVLDRGHFRAPTGYHIA